MCECINTYVMLVACIFCRVRVVCAYYNVKYHASVGVVVMLQRCRREFDNRVLINVCVGVHTRQTVQLWCSNINCYAFNWIRVVVVGLSDVLSYMIVIIRI